MHFIKEVWGFLWLGFLMLFCLLAGGFLLWQGYLGFHLYFNSATVEGKFVRLVKTYETKHEIRYVMEYVFTAPDNRGHLQTYYGKKSFSPVEYRKVNRSTPIKVMYVTNNPNLSSASSAYEVILTSILGWVVGLVVVGMPFLVLYEWLYGDIK